MKKVIIGDVRKKNYSRGGFLECENLGENYERRFLKMKLLRKGLYRKQIKEKNYLWSRFHTVLTSATRKVQLQVKQNWLL